MMLTNDLCRRHHQQQRVAVRREELAKNERKRNKNTSVRSTRKVTEECESGGVCVCVSMCVC